jgi:hypothetical protein
LTRLVRVGVLATWLTVKVDTRLLGTRALARAGDVLRSAASRLGSREDKFMERGRGETRPSSHGCPVCTFARLFLFIFFLFAENEFLGNQHPAISARCTRAGGRGPATLSSWKGSWKMQRREALEEEKSSNMR